jgi:hypothetical protein
MAASRHAGVLFAGNEIVIAGGISTVGTLMSVQAINIGIISLT